MSAPRDAPVATAALPDAQRAPPAGANSCTKEAAPVINTATAMAGGGSMVPSVSAAKATSPSRAIAVPGNPGTKAAAVPNASAPRNTAHASQSTSPPANTHHVSRSCMHYDGLKLDDFQREAIQSLHRGHSVLVSAPTGTGKTLIADWLIDETLKAGQKAVYTAPVKALSNQKYRDYRRRHGEDKVGLVTGDLVINPGAACRVMTTEILRNMLLADDPLTNLAAVVLDEIHFLDDRERGTVWEEVLIYLPKHVAIVGLSATIANVEDFAAWLQHIRERPVDVVCEHRRNVPLEVTLFESRAGRLAPAAFQDAWRKRKGKARGRGRGDDRRGGRGQKRPGRSRRGGRTTTHLDAIRAVAKEKLLPALYFVFSRRDTERCARGLSRSVGDALVTATERQAIDAKLREVAPALGSALTPELRELYQQGIAFHHAGLHVRLKGLVEELYEARLVRVLYCTSTFALGINMPARTVVFDGLRKFDGTRVAPLSTRQFMQKAGRAGRRGMDTEGHVVIRMDMDEYPEHRSLIEKYEKGDYEPVTSSFSLSWNSIVSLLDRHDRDHIRALVEKSFLAWRLAARRKRRAGARPDAVWHDFTDRVGFLRGIGYVDESDGLQAGGRLLLHIQIAELLIVELLLAGVLEGVPDALLFGVLAALTNELPRHARCSLRPSPDQRHIAGRIDKIRNSRLVLDAEEISGQHYSWDRDLILLGTAWAEGHTLEELMERVHCDTDVSGDIISGFRRAKDLIGQIRDALSEDTARGDAMSDLLRRVSRDEVAVIG
jgi:ATP-dependent RNA helicase HelY